MYDSFPQFLFPLLVINCLYSNCMTALRRSPPPSPAPIPAPPPLPPPFSSSHFQPRLLPGSSIPLPPPSQITSFQLNSRLIPIKPVLLPQCSFTHPRQTAHRLPLPSRPAPSRHCLATPAQFTAACALLGGVESLHKRTRLTVATL